MRATADRQLFVQSRAADLRAGGQMVVVHSPRTSTQPFGGLHLARGARTTLADRVYARVAETAAADPEALETLWHVGVLRIAKPT